MKLRLPWKLHIPMKVRQPITGRIFGWYDGKIYKLKKYKGWPTHESIGSHTETCSVFKILGKRSYVELQIEAADYPDTSALIFQAALLGLRLTVTLEDFQENEDSWKSDLPMEPVFGDSITLERLKDYMRMPREGFSS